MRTALTGACLFLAFALAGCAHLEFKAYKSEEPEQPGLTYFEPVPYLAVAKGVDCKVTVNVLVLPGEKRTLLFRSGWGSADLSATLANGMLQSVGQKTDTKVPETVTALAGAAAAFKGPAPGGAKEPVCDGAVRLYPIVKGVPAFDRPLNLPAMN
jgi:hypothetical protein